MFRTALAAAVAATVTTVAHGQALAPTGSDVGSVSALHAKAARNGGKVRIIVEFGGPGVPVPSDASSAGAPSLMSALKNAQRNLISAHFANGASTLSGPDRSLTQMDYVPQFAINATAAEIQRLAADPRVRNIHEDSLARPTLRQSLPIIGMTGATGAFARGAKGQGRVVAVLDTGVLKTHEFLKGKVISEACYNSNVPSQGASSRCPGGVTALTGAGAGADCGASVATGCGHGTHVAGIAAGFNTSVGGVPASEPATGVAPSAKVLAINVFSKFNRLHATQPCGVGATSNCVASFSSDQIKALERVFALRGGILVGKTRYIVDSVNMSLGGGGFTGFCNANPLKPIIDQLRGAGIATVIASGNNSYINGTAAPGCIQTAITVGSSTKRAAGFPERMSYFSNQGPQVDTLAPGGDFYYPSVNIGATKAILSSIVSGGYSGFQGTSMAAPHVAGAIAAIRSRSACRTKTVAQIESALQTTGPLITDHRILPGYPQLKERRMSVPAVMQKIGCY